MVCVQYSSPMYTSDDEMNDDMQPRLQRMRPRASMGPCKIQKIISLPSMYITMGGTYGEGRYGYIHKAKNTETNELVAIKVFRPSNENGVPVDAIRELKLIQSLNHENIITCKEFFFNDATNPMLHMVLPFYELNLSTVLRNKSFDITEPIIKSIIYQVTQGLGAIHEANFVHRDLYPSNILLSTQKPGEVVLADFGISRTIETGNTSRTRRRMSRDVNRFEYRAPEVLMFRPNYGGEIDIWSLGCLLAELYEREPLFIDPNSPQYPSSLTALRILYSIRGPPEKEMFKGEIDAKEEFFLGTFGSTKKIDLSTRFPQEAARVIDTLLAYVPEKRPTVQQILEFYYFESERRTPFDRCNYPWISEKQEENI